MRWAVLIMCVIGVAGGCGEDEHRPVPIPEAVAHPTDPVWCPRARRDESKRMRGAFDARRLIGLAWHEAEARATERDCTLRVVWEDGEGSTITGAADRTRIDVYVDDGRVVGVEWG